MVFGRRRVKSPQWLGVAKVGDAASAMRVSFGASGLPKVRWLWAEQVSSFPALLEDLHKAHHGSLPESSLVLERGQYALISTTAPDVPRQEWADALRWQLRDQVEYPIDDAVIEVLAVPEGSQTRATRASIVLAMPQSQAQQIYVESDDAGHNWPVIEVPETVLRNICALGETDGKAHALMVFGEHYGMLVITHHGELLMTRTIEVAVSAISGAVEARGAALGRAGLEVLRTLDTFERMHSQVTLSELSVALPAGAEGMIEVLGDLVYLPIKQLALSEYLDLSGLGEAGQALAETPSFEQLCALGAALRPQSVALGRQQISMLSRSATMCPEPWGLNLGARLMGATAAVAVALGLGLGAWTAHLTGQAEQAEQALSASGAGAGAPKLPPKPPALIQLEALRETEVRQRGMSEAMTRLTTSSTVPYSEYLMALSRQTPGNLWITGLLILPNGHDLELRGRMINPAVLPDYLARLETEPQFKGRRFAQLQIKALDNDAQPELAGITEFALRAKLTKGVDGGDQR